MTTVSKTYAGKLTRKGKGKGQGFTVKGKGKQVWPRAVDLYLADQDLAARCYNDPSLIIPVGLTGKDRDHSRNAYAAHLSPGHLARTLSGVKPGTKGKG